jgi:hypothetical protein
MSEHISHCWETIRNRFLSTGAIHIGDELQECDSTGEPWTVARIPSSASTAPSMSSAASTSVPRHVVSATRNRSIISAWFSSANRGARCNSLSSRRIRVSTATAGWPVSAALHRRRVAALEAHHLSKCAIAGGIRKIDIAGDSGVLRSTPKGGRRRGRSGRASHEAESVPPAGFEPATPALGEPESSPSRNPERCCELAI